MGRMQALEITGVILSYLLLVPSNSLPNIVYILVDDLGWNDVPWHNPEVLMPNLGAMASSGLILEQTYSQPTCSPSRTALLTGYYPYRTGYQFMPPNNNEPVGLPTSFKILPEYLSKLGYASHAIGQWHLGYCSPGYLPQNRGFDSFYGFWTGEAFHKIHVDFGSAHDNNATLGYDCQLNVKLQ